MALKRTFFVLISILYCLLPALSVKAQLTVEEPKGHQKDDYREFVRKALIGEGVLTGHFEVQAAPGSLGSFHFNTNAELLTDGLVLSTGLVSDIIGPNDTNNTSTSFESPGDADLSKLITRLTADAVYIEFDFIPYTDTISFNYFFASEEYPEYVGKGFNDAFAFLIKGPGYPYYRNIARLDIGPKEIPITIDNINFIRNPEFFIPNHLKIDADFFSKNRKLKQALGQPQLLNEIEFDGMTKKLVASAAVTPFEIYTLKIVIADVGDTRYDSGVFLEKNSFSVKGDIPENVDTSLLYRRFAIEYKNDPAKLNQLVKEHPEIKNKKPELLDTLELSLHFATDSFRVLPHMLQALNQVKTKLKQPERYRIYIQGHTDSVGSDAYNIALSKKRASSVATQLESLGFRIADIKWLGESHPAAPNQSERGRHKNRRVMVQFILRETLD